jgi:hypothetical protein
MTICNSFSNLWNVRWYGLRNRAVCASRSHPLNLGGDTPAHTSLSFGGFQIRGRLPLHLAGETADAHLVDLLLLQDIDGVLPLLLPSFLEALDDFLVLHGFAPFFPALLEQLDSFLQFLSDLAGFEIEAEDMFFAGLNLVGGQGLQIRDFLTSLLNLPSDFSCIFFEVPNNGFSFLHTRFRGSHIRLTDFRETFDSLQTAPRFVHGALL